MLFSSAALLLSTQADFEFKAMTWNIWKGGKEVRGEAGIADVAAFIKESGADVVAMQETYGSGELISQKLKFKFQPRGTNVSILSRYPVVEDISVFEPFKCVGGVIQLPGNRRVAFYSIWLPYGEDIWLPGVRAKSSIDETLKACDPSAVDIEKILGEINKRLSAPKYRQMPVIIAGDFNSMSHLDYGLTHYDQFGIIANWKTSRAMFSHGFLDTFRVANPNVKRMADRTWSPKFPDQEQDRIDFIFSRGTQLAVTGSRVLPSDSATYPSDHAAVLTSFRWQPSPPPREVPLRVVSYNIRHGRGVDGLNLHATGLVLKRLEPDIVGLQEVDYKASRSEGVNQVVRLGEQLRMHPAFGHFMVFDGGYYGMGALSKLPLRNVTELRLPNGNEPRIALMTELALPSGESLFVFNVHFDWVDDDKFRFSQASSLVEFLRDLKHPYVLLGDFNDLPNSRTLKLFRTIAEEVKKPASDHFTFSAQKPEREIDYIFVSPKSRWTVKSMKVVTEPTASDHRPIVAELVLR